MRLRLTKAAAARLAGTRAVVSVRLTVAGGGAKTARTVEVALKGAAKKAAAR